MSALKVRRDILTEADIREVKRVLAEFGNPKSNTALEKWFTLELDALLNYAGIERFDPARDPTALSPSEQRFTSSKPQ
jgi:hypothetical protein